MNNFLKVTIFSLAVIGVYTLFSSWYIPPIKPEEPPKDEAAEISTLSVDELVSLGEQVYNGKGACMLCHNAAGGRAPLLENIATVAEKRIQENGYTGKAVDGAGYIHESMVEPSAYVVKGYGVAGSNDKVSPMPDVRGGSIGLNDGEMQAVVAYLQRLGGMEVTDVQNLRPSGTDADKQAR